MKFFKNPITFLNKGTKHKNNDVKGLNSKNKNIKGPFKSQWILAVKKSLRSSSIKYAERATLSSIYENIL